MGSISLPEALMMVCSLSACYGPSLSASLPTSRLHATGSRKWLWVGSGAGLFSYGDLNTLISEDEGGVGRCQLSVRHCECRIVCGLRGARKRSRVSREVVIDCRRLSGLAVGQRCKRW